MSGHSVSAVILFVGIAALALVSQHTETGAMRSPASLKKELLPGNQFPKHTKKIQGGIESSIELIGAVPEKAGDVFVLKGLVTAASDLRDVEFKWDIPAGLELVNGNVSGTIASLSSKFPAEVQLTLRSRSTENQQVHLMAGAAEEGVRFSDTAQFNTLIQPLIEASKEALAKSTEQVGAPQQKGLKIFH
jgi:hypothetical protein